MNDTVLKVAFPGVLFVFAVSIVVQALQMSGPLAESNAQIYPMVIAGFLALGALGSMVGAVRGTDEVTASSPASAGEADALPSAGDEAAVLTIEETEQETDGGGRRRMLAVLGASVAYPLVMPLLGFHLTTVLYASGLSLLLQERSLKGAGWAVTSGLGVTLFCHLAFVEVLGARLPAGQVF